AMLQSCIRQATDAIAATPMAQVTSCQTQLVRMFQTQQEAVNRSLAVQTRDIASIGQRADALEAEQAAMRKQIGDINKALALAEKELPIMDFQELEAWSRQPNPRIFSIGAPQLVGPAQALQGLEEWIRAAGLTNDMVRIDPAVPSKRFNVLVQGGDGVALPRAQALARQLRDPAGRNGWRSFSAQSVGGGAVPLYLSPDKSPQQVRMEIQSRKLSALLSEALPDQSFSAQRARGIVTSQGVKVAKLEMGESRYTDAIIRWNPDMVARLHIDRESINTQFKKAFSTEDNTEWLRRRKLALLATYMKVNAIIAVQEVHGSEDALSSRNSTPALPAYRFDIVAVGRAALLTIADCEGKYSMQIFNIHNYDLKPHEFTAVQRTWSSGLAWARRDSLHRIFLGVGDFNIAARPPVSQRAPSDTTAWRLRPDHRCQLRQPAWRRLFAAAMEVESQWPTHYDKSCKQLSTIDRIFLGIDAHAMLSVSTILTTARDAMELSEEGISDHAPLVLQITAARHIPRDEQPIPTHLFNHRKYPETYTLMLDHCALAGETAEGRWRAAKQCMKLAARRVRDEQLRTNFSLHVKDSTVETSYMGRLLDSCPALAARLHITDGTLRLVDPHSFATNFDAIAERVHPLRRQAAEAAARTANVRDSAAWRRVERKAARHAQLWVPWRRRMILSGLRVDSAPCAAKDSQVAQRAVSDPAGMKSTVANYWGEIFAKVPNSEQLKALDAFLDKHAPRNPAPIATSSTSPEQKGFTAGRRFVDHIPYLDAECRRKGLLPDAATRRPMFLSFDFRQAFPSLFREVIEKVLPRFGVPLGFRNVVAALYSNCLAFSSFRAEGTSAELEPLFALLCGIMQGCPLSGTVWCLAMDAPIRALLAAIAEHGFLTACADDLGMLIKNAVALPSIDCTFVSIEFAFNLQLALHKCVLVPLWEELSEDTLLNVKSFLAKEVPRWLGFRVDSTAKYLGTHLGPGVTDFGIWKAAAGKWWTRCWELARTGMATSLAARACNINALPCLSYLAQFYFIVPAIWKVEFTSLHRLLRLPPSSMRKADILSMSAWCGSPSPIGLFPYTLAAMMRSAENTVRGWEAHLHHLHEAAVEHVPLIDAIKGNWSPPWWQTRRAIAQNFAMITDTYGQLDIPRPTLDVLSVPIPSRYIKIAKSAMTLETKTAAAATPTRKPKRQATAAASLRGSLYPEDLVATIHRRLRRWGVECPLPELRERWPPLRGKLTEVRPAWMWSWIRTAVNGWTTSRRMSAVIDARPCLFGCDAEDALEHYVVCPILRAMTAGDAGADSLGNGAELLGFGDEQYHAKRPITDCIYSVDLMCQCYHIQKHRMHVGLDAGADQRAGVRLAALHRMQA
ncbi:unnamed protein product, partial [Prorocentrum cordatum]